MTTLKKNNRNATILSCLTTLLLLSIISENIQAQNIGINSTGAAPAASAILDVSATNKGLLVPRVALTTTNAAGPISSPATSLLVYNTATAGSAPNNVVPGYYYWNGSAWISLTTASTTWSSVGNSGTTAGTNFIGTTDAVDFVVKTNNTEKARVSSAGNVGIGTSTFNSTYPEKLVVDAGTTTSVNAIVGKGSINSYLQLNIQNQSNGSSASSDVVATSDNGSETTNYVDMGINSSTNNSGVMGNANDAYLYNIGQNFLLGTGSTSKSLVFMTGGTTQSSNERMRIDGNGKVGIGNTSPTEVLDVTGNLKFSGALMPNNSAGTSGYVLSSNGAGAAPTWVSVASVTGTYWALDGSTLTSMKKFGTVSNHDIPFITNNTERMRVTNTGNIGIGTSTFDATYPEKLIVNAGTTSSVNAIVGKGSINNYLQLNIQNQSSGTNASSDVVATADNGNETTNYVDMGINSSTNSSGIMGSANDAYLYNLGQNFLMGTGTASKSLIFMTGGTSQASNERMRIDGTGKVGIGNTSPSEVLDVTGNLKFSGALMPNNSAGTTGYVLTSNGAGASPTWASVASVTGTYWALDGSTLTSMKKFGTISNHDIPFITNNVERMRVTNTGNIGIGTSTFDATYPEKLVVNAGTTSSVNAIVGKGSINNYLQLNIQNQSSGSNASSDVVATADNGNETTNYVDMGINSSTNSGGVMGGANDAYLYNLGQNFLMGTGTASKSLIFMTGGTSQASNERMRISGTGKVGIANTNPTEALDVTGNMRFSGALMPNNNAGTSGYILTSAGAGAAPTWSSAASLAGASDWVIDGNAVAANKNFGTTTNFSLPFITNNVERMRINNTGNVGIGTSTFNATYPEKLVVDAGTTTSVNAIVGKGSINSYLQLNIQNQSNGSSASSDVVATADNGSETTNYVDMGINSSTNNSGIMGNSNDAYLYNLGQNFLIGAGTAAKALIFMTGGTTQTTNERMRISGTGNVGIGTTAPNSTLQVNGSLAMTYHVGSGSYTLLATDYVIINTGAAATWTLPAANTCPGRIYKLINQGTGNITFSRTVRTASASTFTALTYAVSGNRCEIISDGTEWRKIGG
jgi:hypothetical protein